MGWVNKTCLGCERFAFYISGFEGNDGFQVEIACIAGIFYREYWHSALEVQQSIKDKLSYANGCESYVEEE